jgi:hypothetical protein
MAETETLDSPQIHVLLAENGYEVSDVGPNVFSIRQPESGITIQSVVEGEVMFFSLTCLTVPREKITLEIAYRLLAADNGISTSHFQLYDLADGQTAIALSNFCKLQEMGADDEDDILSCVHFLLADVMSARNLLSELQ